MHELEPMELALAGPAIEAMVQRVNAREPKSEGPRVVLVELALGLLRAWRHGDTLALVERTLRDGRNGVCVVFYAGTIRAIVDWVRECEAECRRRGWSEIEIRGRRGWWKISESYRLGFGPWQDGMIKRLD